MWTAIDSKWQQKYRVLLRYKYVCYCAQFCGNILNNSCIGLANWNWPHGPVSGTFIWITDKPSDSWPGNLIIHKERFPKKSTKKWTGESLYSPSSKGEPFANKFHRTILPSNFLLLIIFFIFFYKFFKCLGLIVCVGLLKI